MKATKLIIIALAISLLGFGFAIVKELEDPFVTSLKNFVSSFYTNKQWEKIYLHIDKPLYKPGEEIWFKAYLINGATNQPSGKSDVVYAELIDPRGNVSKTLTLQVINGACNGNFSLDENINGGIFKIKAYSTWMKNFGIDYFFEKDIQVQKVVYPRILAKIDFKRETYAPGDTVVAELKIETLENIPLSFHEVKADFSLAGEKVHSSAIQTNNKGIALLHFILPASLKTSDGLVNCKLLHEGSTEAVSRSIPIVLNEVSVDFLPEGGYLVENIPGNVAFKAVNEFGKPAEVEGYVTDSSNSRILEFRSFHQGMGAFEMVPVPGKRYYAVITKPHIERKFELPEAMPRGYTMKVVSLGNNRYKAVYHTPVREKVYLAIQAGDHICFSKTENSVGMLNEIEFSADKFPVGTALVTLFDKNGVPRCERLMFFNHDKRLHISLKFDKEKYAPREKVSLRIRTSDKDSIPVSASLSLAVVNDQLLTMINDRQHNVLSWLYLGSEIKGKVEKPDFYFNPEEPRAAKALDYLMLTQGWRRYYWDQILSSQYNLLYPAECIGTISGTLKDKRTGKPVRGEVVVIELQNRKRILKVNTTGSGKFRFENADASAYIQVMARSSEIEAGNVFIEIDHLNKLTGPAHNIVSPNNQVVPEMIKIKANLENKDKEMVAMREDVPENTGVDVKMVEDIKKLEEVVVVGYGIQKKADLTGSVVTVKAQDVLSVPLAVEQALQGRASGVSILNDKGQPGMAPQVRIRGTASVSGNEPLFVVDGVVYDPSVSGGNFLLQNIPASSINNITVLKDASATSIYGHRAANGVIVINTTSNNGYYKSVKKNFKPRYSGYLISPRSLSVGKEFYYPVYKQNVSPEVRNDFRSTVYWNPGIVTNNAGEAEVEFYASDEITAFRAVAEGIGKTGDIGRSEVKYHSQLPFSMAVKFPGFITFADTVIMPLIIKNNTSKTLKGKMQYSVPENINPLIVLPDSVEIMPNSDRNISVPFFVRNKVGKGMLQISFKSDNHKDAFSQEIEVLPKGFPTSVSVSGKEKEKSFRFVINKPVPGSIKAEFNAFPDIISDLMSGVESILREPYGCFEQTSSSTYPNIMVLSYLNATGSNDQAVADKALKLIKTGYTRLTGFETSSKGYEWFGHAPAHDGLTAYGLMEFSDMKKVYTGVDKNMVDRTLNWLLAQRDGKGNFRRNSRSLDQFGRASNQVSNAYIVYALSEAGVNQLDLEYQTALVEAKTSMDPYRLSLMANAAFNFKKSNDGNFLLGLLESKLQKDSWDKIRIEHSITMSGGKSLQVETASLFVLALLKSPDPDWNLLEKSVNYLVSSRSTGGFGSTQATILALKALTEYARYSVKTSGSGTIELLVNGKAAVNHSFIKGEKGKIIYTGLEKYLTEGENTLTVRYPDSETILPYTFDAKWNSATPTSDSNCNLMLKTSLSNALTKIGETVRLNIKLQNTSENGLPMSMAVVGIPSGLSLQPWQLKEIREKEKIDFYEISKNYLVLYYRQMAPGESKDINLDLRAEIAGTYQAPASCTYLYYTNEYKYWIDGEVIKINK